MKKKKISAKRVASRCPKCRGDICDRYEVCLANYKKQNGSLNKAYA